MMVHQQSEQTDAGTIFRIVFNAQVLLFILTICRCHHQLSCCMHHTLLNIYLVRD